MVSEATRNEAEDDEAGERDSFKITATARLELVKSFQSAPTTQIARESCEQVAAWTVVVPGLPQRDQSRKCIADHREAQPREQALREGGQLEGKLRHSPPRLVAASKADGDGERGEDRHGKVPVLSIAPRDALRQAL